MKIHIYQGKNGKHFWRAVERNGRTVADGAQGYSRQSGAVRGARNVIGEFSRNPEIVIDE